MTLPLRVRRRAELDIDEVVDLPGVMTYSETADAALAHVQALALRVLADRLDHDEGPP